VSKGTRFICQECGYSQVGWAGRCPNCNTWGSLVERQASTETKEKTGLVKKPKPLNQVSADLSERLSTGISEFDRVLGGGFVQGQVILVAGEPGIGKSTLLLQTASNLAQKGFSVGYVCGEESPPQIKLRAQRLGIEGDKLYMIDDSNVGNIIKAAKFLKERRKKETLILVIDSVQTLNQDTSEAMAGSVFQIRESTSNLIRLAKKENISIFMVGHVTKEGLIAGPSYLMHMVDTLIWLEGDRYLTTRILRSIKNRFGPTDEVGIFEMGSRGLIGVSEPENIFLTQLNKNLPGSVIACVFQGTRPILVEIQSLVVPTKLAFPKRVSQGIEMGRLEMLLAVLIGRCGIPFFDFDCFVNVTGGISLKGDPSADLAVCLSLASSFYKRNFKETPVAIGEVGLLGDIRKVSAEEKRLKEAKRLGFKLVITRRDSQFVSGLIKRYLSV